MDLHFHASCTFILAMVFITPAHNILLNTATVLTPDKAVLYNLPAKFMVEFQLVNISERYTYAIFQVHSQYQNLTVSLTRKPYINTSMNNSNAGLVTLLHQGQTKVSWFVYSNHNVTVRILVLALLYAEQDPLPGGCNTEFDLENYPNINISGFTDYHTVLTFQWGNVGFGRDPQHGTPICQATDLQQLLTYDIYQYFLPRSDLSEESYFDAMKKMMSVNSVMRYGQKVTSLHSLKQHPLAHIASSNGDGVIYNIIQTMVFYNETSRAAYVPAASYGCQFTGNNNLCADISHTLTFVLATLGGMVGLVLCFLGHRLFKTEMFVFGFLAFSIVFFNVFSIVTNLHLTDQLIVTAVLGLVGGSLWLAFWWFCGIPVLSVLLVGLVLGYLVSSITFYTPFGTLEFWSSNFNFGMTFACIVLVAPVLLLYWTKTLNIISCAVVGSYGVMTATSSYVFASLADILLNSFKRATIRGFNKSFILPNFHTKDIILCTCWVLLAIAGAVFQFVREHKKPPFPPHPYKEYKARKAQRNTDQAVYDDEDPLLSEQSQNQIPSVSGRHVQGVSERHVQGVSSYMPPKIDISAVT